MKLERAVPCAAPPRLVHTPLGIMTLPAIVVAASVALATLIVGLHA
jgi:hypothetical protein